MKFKSEYTIKKVDNAFAVLKNGTETGITLNEHSAHLWELNKEKEVSKSQMLESLLKAFDISTVLALGEIDNFLRMMKENEIVE